MKTPIKKLWLEALRSGQYKKGTGALCKDNKFCCLGVLTDLYVRENPKRRKWEQTERGELAYNGESGELPDAVQRWAGLYQRDPKAVKTPEGGYITLAGLNDGSRSFANPLKRWNRAPWSFEKIADAIEKKF